VGLIWPHIAPVFGAFWTCVIDYLLRHTDTDDKFAISYVLTAPASPGPKYEYMITYEYTVSYGVQTTYIHVPVARGKSIWVRWP
jgi:hypothetical protein